MYKYSRFHRKGGISVCTNNMSIHIFANTIKIRNKEDNEKMRNKLKKNIYAR